VAGYLSGAKLRGDFDIQVEFRLLTWPAANGMRVGFTISDEAGGDVMGIQQHNDGQEQVS